MAEEIRRTVSQQVVLFADQNPHLSDVEIAAEFSRHDHHWVADIVNLHRRREWANIRPKGFYFRRDGVEMVELSPGHFIPRETREKYGL